MDIYCGTWPILFDELAVWNVDSLVSRVILFFLAVNQDIEKVVFETILC